MLTMWMLGVFAGLIAIIMTVTPASAHGSTRTHVELSSRIENTVSAHGISIRWSSGAKQRKHSWKINGNLGGWHYQHQHNGSSHQDSERYLSYLAGSLEVPPVQTDGRGTGQFTLNGNTLQYRIQVDHLSSGITAAHFHLGEPGVAGPVLQSISFSENLADGSWTGLTDQQLQDLRNGKIYVNVHTSTYPNGEIRGQVVR